MNPCVDVIGPVTGHWPITDRGHEGRETHETLLSGGLVVHSQVVTKGRFDVELTRFITHGLTGYLGDFLFGLLTT